MRVLHVIDSLILAGAEALTKDLALEFKRQGIDVTVVALKRLHSAFEQELSEAGVPVLFPSAGGIFSPLQVFPLRHVFRNYDVVHAHLFPATLWVAMAAGNKTRPVLVTSEQNTLNRRRRPLWRKLDRWMYSRYAAIACASTAIRDALVEWIPELASRTTVVPNAVNLKTFSEAQAVPRRAVVGDAVGPVVISVARFEPQKDHATLLRALAEVRNAQLLLVGDGPTRGAMERLATSLGLANRVHFLGRRADVASLLGVADAFVQSSRWEGFGIAALEAMAAALPVIASDVAGLNEIVRDAGILFPAGDVAALAAALERVLASKPLQAQFARQSRARAEQFSLQRCAQAYLEIYRKLLAQGSG